METADLEKAIAAGDIDSAKLMLATEPECGLAITTSGVSALLLALYHGKAQIAEALAEPLDRLPLFEAAAMGHLGSVKALLDAEPEWLNAWSVDGFQAHHLAAFFARREVLAYLLSKGADPNQRARQPAAMTPLHSAAASRQAELVADLLAAGADPNLQQGGGFTALMSAAMHGNLPMMQVLLAAGADTALRADDGRSARDMAQQGGHAAAVALLDVDA